jgi:hypothetical protein
MPAHSADVHCRLDLLNRFGAVWDCPPIISVLVVPRSPSPHRSFPRWKEYEGRLARSL